MAFPVTGARYFDTSTHPWMAFFYLGGMNENRHQKHIDWSASVYGSSVVCGRCMVEALRLSLGPATVGCLFRSRPWILGQAKHGRGPKATGTLSLALKLWVGFLTAGAKIVSASKTTNIMFLGIAFAFIIPALWPKNMAFCIQDCA